MSSTHDFNKSSYIHLLDLARLLSMMAIVTFHVNEFAFYSTANPIYSQAYLYRLLHEFARLLPYSGHYIIFISFFLIGFRDKVYKKLPYWLALFLLTHLMIMLAFSNGNVKEIQFEWDIYPFLGVTFFTIGALQKLKRVNWNFIFALCLIILVLPFDLLEVSANYPFFKMIFSGLCEHHGLGSWPLYPWLALPFLGLSCGKIVINHFTKFKVMSMYEVILWVSASLLALFGFYSYHLKISQGFPIGNGFYCFILRRPPSEMWSSFFWIMLITRLSLLRGVNNYLQKLKIFIFFKKLNWNQNFVLTYIVHILILWIGSSFDGDYLKSPILFDAYWIVVFIGSDIIVSLLNLIYRSRKVSNDIRF